MKRFGYVLVTVLGLAACGSSIEDRMAEVTISELQGQLRDPGSLELMDTKVRISAEWGAVCGEYNAANGFGGMAGRQRFVRVFSQKELQVLQAKDISQDARDLSWQVLQSRFEIDEGAAEHAPVTQRVERTRGLFLEPDSPILTVRYMANHCVIGAKPVTLKP